MYFFVLRLIGPWGPLGYTRTFFYMKLSYNTYCFIKSFNETLVSNRAPVTVAVCPSYQQPYDSTENCVKSERYKQNQNSLYYLTYKSLSR